MANVTISRTEIEKMLKDQMKLTGLKWNDDGSVSVGIEFEDLKQKEKEIVHIPVPYYYPYLHPSPTIHPPRHPPYWIISNRTNTATYQCAKGRS